MSFHYLKKSGGAWLKSDGTYYQLEIGQAPNTPSVVGLNYPEAQMALQKAGLYVPASVGYFGTFPISIQWRTSAPSGFAFGISAFGVGAFGSLAKAPGIVVDQYPTPTMYSPPNAPIVLGCFEFPFGVAFP